MRKLGEDVWSSGKKKVWGKVGKGEVKCRNRSDMVPVQRERGERREGGKGRSEGDWNSELASNGV